MLWHPMRRRQCVTKRILVQRRKFCTKGRQIKGKVVVADIRLGEGLGD